MPAVYVPAHLSRPSPPFWPESSQVLKDGHPSFALWPGSGHISGDGSCGGRGLWTVPGLTVPVDSKLPTGTLDGRGSAPPAHEPLGRPGLRPTRPHLPQPLRREIRRREGTEETRKGTAVPVPSSGASAAMTPPPPHIGDPACTVNINRARAQGRLRRHLSWIPNPRTPPPRRRDRHRHAPDRPPKPPTRPLSHGAPQAPPTPRSPYRRPRASHSAITQLRSAEADLEAEQKKGPSPHIAECGGGGRTRQWGKGLGPQASIEKAVQPPIPSRDSAS